MSKVKKAWMSHRIDVTPNNFKLEHLIITKSAFYAGFASALDSLVRSVGELEDSKIPEFIKNHITDTFKELAEFSEEIDTQAEEIKYELDQMEGDR